MRKETVRHSKTTPGLTVSQYERLLRSQQNKCAICLKGEVAKDARYGATKLLSVDHCHKTGEVRGLLCDNCNRGLGLFKEDVDTLSNAISYLEQHYNDF
jgi:hypothetical protein